MMSPGIPGAPRSLVASSLPDEAKVLPSRELSYMYSWRLVQGRRDLSVISIANSVRRREIGVERWLCVLTLLHAP